MSLGTLDASLLWNISAGKGVICGGLGVIRAGEGTNRAEQDFNAASSFE